MLLFFDKIDSSNSSHDHSVPEVSSEVLRVSFERHQKGSMHPWIYHCLTKVKMTLIHLNTFSESFSK